MHGTVLLYFLDASLHLSGLPDPSGESGALKILANPTMVKFLFVVVALLGGAIVGLLTGFLTKLSGRPGHAALIAAGSAFGGSVGLALVILGYLLP